MKLGVSFREWNEANLSYLRREIPIVEGEVAKAEAAARADLGSSNDVRVDLTRGVRDCMYRKLRIHEDETAARAEYARLAESRAARKAAA